MPDIKPNLQLETIRCLPKGICSWNFNLSGEAFAADVAFNLMSEQGQILLDGLVFEVVKPTMFDGHWKLEYKDQEVASASKTTALLRVFEVSSVEAVFSVRPAFAMSNSFLIEQDGVVMGRIVPDHMFTRRATIHMDHEMQPHHVAFAFWLTVLMRRRAAQS
ncbi:MAG: hypothetical protein AAF564_20235 [Bacteroidota bacterium]